jgi:hypothetical protein
MAKLSQIAAAPSVVAGPVARPRAKAAQARSAPATLSARGFLGWFAASFLLSFALLWIYVATLPMAFMNRDFPLLAAKRMLLAECRPNTVDVFGDSRAVAGIVPQVMPFPVTNFAMSGTSPVETYFAVKRVLGCPQPPRLVVIAHSAVKYTSDNDFWTFSARTGFLNYAELRQVEGDAKALHDHQLDNAQGGVPLPPWLRDRLFAARFPPLYFSSLVNGFVAARYWHNKAAMQASLETSGQALFGRVPGSASIADEAENSPFHVLPLTDLYFQRSLALLAAHKVPVVILTMPLNQATYREMSPQLGRSFDAYLTQRVQRLPNVLLADSRIPCWPNRAFGDAWHFNQAGAEAYSRGLGARLQAIMAGSTDSAQTDRCTGSGGPP